MDGWENEERRYLGADYGRQRVYARERDNLRTGQPMGQPPKMGQPPNVMGQPKNELSRSCPIGCPIKTNKI